MMVVVMHWGGIYIYIFIYHGGYSDALGWISWWL